MHQNASFFRTLHMERLEPSKNLRKNILLTIVKEERQRAKKYLAVSFAVASASAVGLVFSIQYIAQAISQSSFYQYLSLLFSDSDIVLSYWKSFAMSLVESMPFFAVTLVLFAVVALMMSIRVLIKNSGRNFSPSFSN